MASYELLILPSAKREIEAIEPRADRELIVRRIGALAPNPRPAGCEKPAGVEGHYRVRQGNYRVIYRVEDHRLVIVVVKVGHRREVYR